MIKNKTTLKIYCIVSMLLLIFLFFNTTQAEAVTDNPSQREQRSILVERGIKESTVEKMPDSQVTKLYNFVMEKNTSFRVTSKTITKTFPNNVTRGDIEDEDLTFYCDLYISGGKTPMAFADYWFEWAEGKPLIRMKDAITINWNSNEFVPEGFADFGVYYKVNPNAFDWETAYHMTGASVAGSVGGVGYNVDFTKYDGKKPVAITCSGLGGTINLIAARPLAAGTALSMTFTYYHSRNPLPVDLSFSFGKGGASVSVDTNALTDTKAFMVSDTTFE